MSRPIIADKKCNLCGTCVDICPMNVLKMGDDNIKIAETDECIACRACEAQCEKSAIVVED